MKEPKINIQIATIGQLGNTAVMNVYLEKIDIQDDGDSVVWYKEPKGRKVKGQYLDEKLIVLKGWDNFDKWTIKVQCGEISTVQEHWDGTLQLRTKEGQKAIDLWERIYRENLNPNFARYDLLKINDQVLYTIKETLSNEDKYMALAAIFQTLQEINDINKDTDAKMSIEVVGKRGATWYLTEWNPLEHTFFGYASLFHDHNDEWGTIPESDLLEMNAVVIPHSQKQMRNHKYYKNN